MPLDSLRISENVTDEIARIESEIASLTLRLGTFQGKWMETKRTRGTQTRIAGLQERLRILKEPGSDDPHITPRPDTGPAFSSGDPLFSGPRLDTGRVGVDALKLISYPSQAT